MSVNLPSHYVKQFANTIQLKLQQNGSKVRPFVMEGMHKGEMAAPVDQIDSIEMQEPEARFAPLSRTDAPVDRRWCSPVAYDLNQLVDPWDELQMLLDPKGKYVENAVKAAGRKFDDIIIDSFFGAASTGKAGATSTTFPADQQISVSQGAASATGMTVAKLRAAKKLLMANEVNVESDPITAILTARQIDDLLAEIEVIHQDYKLGAQVNSDGLITKILGINIVHCERLETDGSSYRRIPVFAKSGMHLGIWQDVKTDISQRKDLSGHPWQAYVQMMAGATRLEEEKIVEIKCSEA